MIFDSEIYPNKKLSKICKISVHFKSCLETHGPDVAREIIHGFLIEQREVKPQHAKNLRELVDKVLKIINSRYKHLKVIFEIEK